MNNLFKQKTLINRKDRQKLNSHSSFLLLFTGLSGSGKSTLAIALEKKLYENGKRTYLLDGDNIRLGLNNDLGFSEVDRKENLRRIGEVAKLFVDAGIITLAAFVAPYQEDRDKMKATLGENDFLEIFVDTPLEECERRDVKGLYLKARAGEIKHFTGISAPYENPINPFLVVKTQGKSIDDCTEEIFNSLQKKLSSSL